MKKHQIITYNIQIILIVLLYQFLCLYKITDIPYGYNIDEAGTAVDAYFLANFGVDRYNTSWPVYFMNYGGGQNALNQYLCAITVRLFGFNMLQIKIPGVVVNVIGLIYLIKLFQKLFNEKYGLITGLIYQISPYGIMRSRTVLESNLALPIMIIAVYYTYKAVEEQQDEAVKYWVISGILYGLVCYAYIYELPIIGIYLILSLAYCIKHKKINVKQAVQFSVQMILVLVPLIIFNLVNIFGTETLQLFGVSFVKLAKYRSDDAIHGDILQKLLIVIKVMFYGDNLQYNTSGFGIFYITSIIIVIYSIIVNYNKLDFSKYTFKMFLIFLLISNIIMNILNVTNCNKFSTGYISILMLLILGIISYKKLQKQKIIQIIVTAQYIIQFMAFGVWYYTQSNKEALGSFQMGSFVEAVDDIENISGEDSQIIHQTEKKTVYELMRLLDGKQDTPEYFNSIPDKNFGLHDDCDIESGVYIIRNDKDQLIQRFNILTSDGFAEEFRYKHYNIYNVQIE